MLLLLLDLICFADSLLFVFIVCDSFLLCFFRKTIGYKTPFKKLFIQAKKRLVLQSPFKGIHKVS